MIRCHVCQDEVRSVCCVYAQAWEELANATTACCHDCCPEFSTSAEARQYNSLTVDDWQKSYGAWPPLASPDMKVGDGL